MLQARGHSRKREFSAVFHRNGVDYLRQFSSSYSFGAGRLRVGLIQPRGRTRRYKRFTRKIEDLRFQISA